MYAVLCKLPLQLSAQTETSKRTVSVDEAAAKQAKSQYDDALLQLSYTDIVAPVSGTIGHKTLEVGQQIERGQALMSIVSDEKWVVANFKETQLAKMRVGQQLILKLMPLPINIFTAKFTRWRLPLVPSLLYCRQIMPLAILQKWYNAFR